MGMGMERNCHVFWIALPSLELERVLSFIRFVFARDSRRYYVVRFSVCLRLCLCRISAIVIDLFGDALFRSGGLAVLIVAGS